MKLWAIAFIRNGKSDFEHSLDDKFNAFKPNVKAIETQYKQCFQSYIDKMQQKMPCFKDEDFERHCQTIRHTEWQKFNTAFFLTKQLSTRSDSLNELEQKLKEIFEQKLLHSIKHRFKYLKNLNEEKKRDTRKSATTVLSIVTGAAAFVAGGPLGLAIRVGFGLMVGASTKVAGDAIIDNGTNNSTNEKKK